ncbi:MAG: hypothetical protein IPM84_07450 [Anaerolineae bacterium]|nr:hypothetical protein [Anaerolineae bacterium]
MTGKPPPASRAPSARDEAPGHGQRQADRPADKTAQPEPRRNKTPRPVERQPGRSAERAPRAETRRENGPEGKNGPPHRRRERIITHAPRPVSTTPVAAGAARSSPPAPAIAQRPAAAPIVTQEETDKSPERKVFIYTYTIWNRSTSP